MLSAGPERTERNGQDMNVYDELKARGMIAQATNEEKIRELL